MSHNTAMYFIFLFEFGLTARYRFKLPRPNDTLGLPIGQHIQIVAQIGDKEIQRSYTPISSDDDRGHFDLMIKVPRNLSDDVLTRRVTQKETFPGQWPPLYPAQQSKSKVPKAKWCTHPTWFENWVCWQVELGSRPCFK